MIFASAHEALKTPKKGICDFAEENEETRARNGNFHVHMGDFHARKGDFRVCSGDFRVCNGDFYVR